MKRNKYKKKPPKNDEKNCVVDSVENATSKGVHLNLGLPFVLHISGFMDCESTKQINILFVIVSLRCTYCIVKKNPVERLLTTKLNLCYPPHDGLPAFGGRSDREQ